MAYEWICEKCGDHNKSSSNVCKNPACKWVFQGHFTVEYVSIGRTSKTIVKDLGVGIRADAGLVEPTVIRCDRCGKEAIGNKVFRKGRNMTTPIMRLSMADLNNKDFEVYGEAGKKYLSSLYSMVGQKLCPGCHPNGLGLKVNCTIQSPEEVGPGIPDSIRERIAEDNLAYKSMEKEVRSKLEAIRERNPGMTREEQIEVAKKIIRKIDNYVFRCDQIETKIRRIVRSAIVSKISFRKNISKDRLKESLYNFHRIVQASLSGDFSHLKKVLREEARNVVAKTDDLLSEARKGPDLFSTIEEVTQLMVDKSDEIAQRENRLKEEAPIALRLDAKMHVLFGRLEKLKAAMSANTDRIRMSRLSHLISDVGARYTKVCEEAWRYIPVPMIDSERESIDRMHRRFFTHYAPLMHALRRIIFWDIKADMWSGDYHQPGCYIDAVEVYPNGYEGKPKRFAAINYTRKPANTLLEVTCEVCKQGSMAIRVVNNIYAVPVHDIYGVADSKVGRVKLGNGDIYDIVPGSNLSKEDKAAYKRITLLVCPGCSESGNYLERLLSLEDNITRLRAEIVKGMEEKSRSRKAIESNMASSYKSLQESCEKTSMIAKSMIEKAGALYAAPIVKVNKETLACEIRMVAVSAKNIPDEILVHGMTIKVIRTDSLFFSMSYYWNYISDKERDEFKKRAKLKGYRADDRGLYRQQPDLRIIIDLVSVLRELEMIFPEFPIGYWKVMSMFCGERSVHPILRDVVSLIPDDNVEPIALECLSQDKINGLLLMMSGESGFKGSDDELLKRLSVHVRFMWVKEVSEREERRKVILKEIKVRQGEAMRMWSPLKKRRKGGGASPKAKDKRTVKQPGLPPGTINHFKVDREGSGLPETSLDSYKVFYAYDPESKFYVSLEEPIPHDRGVYDYHKDPSLKDLSKFLMVGAPYSGDSFIKKPWTEEKEAKWLQALMNEALVNREDDKKEKEKHKKLWKKMDPSTFQRIRLKK